MLDELITRIPADEEPLCGNTAVYAVIIIIIIIILFFLESSERRMRPRTMIRFQPPDKQKLQKAREQRSEVC